MIEIHPQAVVHKSAELEDGVRIGPNCVVGENVTIGAGTVLEANVVVYNNVGLGRDNHLYPSCVIGAPPQILDLNDRTELGRVVIGDRNTFREQVTIHPSIHKDRCTKIGSENLLMVGVHIGHDCTLEDKIVMSNYVQVAGHCKIETGVWLSGVVCVHQFCTLGKWSYAAGMSGINRDIPPFLMISGHYPLKVRGVNKRGLVRAGLTEEQQRQIYEAFERLYRRGGTLLENAKNLAKEDGLDENVRSMIDAIINSSKHRFGRYLELFRD